MIQFYLKPSKEKDALIMMRIYNRHFKDGVFAFSTKIRIKPNDWDKKNKAPKWNSHEIKVTSYLEDKAKKFMLDNEHPGFTREMLRDHLAPEKKEITLDEDVIEENKSIIQLWEEYHSAVSHTVEDGTKRSYGVPLNSLRAFLIENKISEITPAKFDFKLYQKYVGWLRSKYEESTEGKYLKVFKRFISHLEDEKITIGFNKSIIKYSSPAGLQNTFSEDKLNQLFKRSFKGKFIDRKNKNGKVNLEDVKWLLILQCNTSFRISDLKRVDQNISGDFIKIETKKTGTLINQPITEKVRHILDLYNNQLPKMNDADLNLGIKEIYRIMWPDEKVQIRNRQTGEFNEVPLHTKIRSHDAVRTFVTLALQKGMVVPNVATMVGKSPAVIWKHYNKSSEEMAQQDMRDKFGVPVKGKAKRKNQSGTLSLGL